MKFSLLLGSLNTLKEAGSLYDTEHLDSQDQIAPWYVPHMYKHTDFLLQIYHFFALLLP